MSRINELQNVLAKSLNWNKARIACLAQIIQALICARTSNLTQIASFFQTGAKSDSSYRRVRRFFAEYVFDIRLIIPFVLTLFPLKGNLILILDRTSWKWGKKEINILMLSIANRGIGIPLFWSVSNHFGCSSIQARMSLLDTVIRILGKGRIKAILGDREFMGEEWFSLLKRAKIPFIIRVKKGSLAGGIRNFYQVPILELWKGRGRSRQILNHPVLLKKNFLYASIRKGNGAKEPIIVVSNIEVENAVALYQKRWEIETLFSCLKTRGFNLEDTHITAPERIEKLLFVLTIAFCWSYKIGVYKCTPKGPRKKGHGRSWKSLFRIGLDWLKRVLFSIETEFDEFKEILRIITHCKSTTWRCV